MYEVESAKIRPERAGFMGFEGLLWYFLRDLRVLRSFAVKSPYSELPYSPKSYYDAEKKLREWRNGRRTTLRW